MLTPQQWEQIDRIFMAAAELQPAQRESFLDEVCAGDELLRQEVESLLAHDAPETLIAGPAVEEASRLLRKEKPLISGERIGTYLIIKSIGAGGMGEVYLAKDKFGRMVALKVLNKHFEGSDSGVARFQQEARSLLALNHPNIVTIYDIGQVDSVYYIASELVEGETLRQRIDKGDIDVAESLEIAIQIGTALAAAHEKGIVHRDVKPENVMIRRDGYVKVLDFGIARLTANNTVTDSDALTVRKIHTEEGTVVGTAPYMSPEQARGLTVDARTDNWSLAVVIYESIAGRKPFYGETVQDVLRAVLEKEPAPLARYANDIPEGLEWIVSRALRKEIEARYQTASELLFDLKELRKRMDFEKSVNSKMASGDTQAMGLTSLSNHGSLALPAAGARSTFTPFKDHKLAVIISALILSAAIVGLVAYRRGSDNGAFIQSIAVLPFENQNQDPNSDYLSDGLTENIINNLAQFPNLRVIPRNSAFHYKGRQSDSMAAGRELGVRAVVTGRIMQMGDNLVVSAELVDIRDNKQLWGEQYERKVSDALTLQQEISLQISEKLRLKLTGDQQKQLNKGGTNDAEAYQLYTKGRYYLNKRGTSGSLQKSIDQFQQAVQRDPNYALAYVGLAESYGLLEEYTGIRGAEPLQKAKAFAERALQIDNSLAEAHSALAYTFECLWSWADADREYRLSISLNPNYPTARQWHGELLLWMDRYDEGVAEFKRAQELDPLSLINNMWLAEIYFRRGDTEGALRETNKVLELDRDYPRPHQLLGLVFLRQGRHEEATAEFQKAVELSGRGSGSLRSLGIAYGISGKRAEAMDIIEELEKQYEKQETHARNIAAVYAGLGNKDQVFAWLEKDFNAHSSSLPAITIDSSFESLRNDPRYIDLLRRMRLRN